MRTSLNKQAVGVALTLALVVGVSSCRHVPKVEPGSLALHVTGDTAESLKKLIGHTAISATRYGTLYLTAPENVTAYLECHEDFHTMIQATRYPNDIVWLQFYFGESVKSALLVLRNDVIADPMKWYGYVVLIIRNKLDFKALHKDTIEGLVRLAYEHNQFEREAHAACAHLSETKESNLLTVTPGELN